MCDKDFNLGSIHELRDEVTIKKIIQGRKEKEGKKKIMERFKKSGSSGSSYIIPTMYLQCIIESGRKVYKLRQGITGYGQVCMILECP